MATHTSSVIAIDPIIFSVVGVNIIGTLAHTHLTGNTSIFISFNSEFCGE